MIGAIEDEIVARLRTGFEGRLREVDSKPARFTAEELERILSAAPAAYVAFLGWTRNARAQRVGSFGVYLVAAHAAGERARRRGDDATIGAYEMSEIATGLLERWLPPSAAGAVTVTGAENLFAAAFEKLGRTVYGLALTMLLPEGTTPKDGDLTPFVTFNAQWDVPPIGNVGSPPPAPNPDAEDRVLLPQ